MEVKIGVQYAPRELVLESAQSPAEVEQTVTDAFADDGGMLSLTDEKGRRVIVPVGKVAYVEIAEASPARGRLHRPLTYPALPRRAARPASHCRDRTPGAWRQLFRPTAAIRAVCAAVSRRNSPGTSTRSPPRDQRGERARGRRRRPGRPGTAPRRPAAGPTSRAGWRPSGRPRSPPRISAAANSAYRDSCSTSRTSCRSGSARRAGDLAEEVVGDAVPDVRLGQRLQPVLRLGRVVVRLQRRRRTAPSRRRVGTPSAASRSASRR